MPTVFIVVVSLATYAVGAVTTRRMTSWFGAAVHPIEVLLAGGALVGIALARRPPHTGTYCVLCAGSMLVIGATISRLTTGNKVAGGTREFEDPGTTAGAAAGAWKRWLSFSRAVVDYEFRLLLVACYLLIIGPVAMAFRFLGAGSTGSSAASNWILKNDAPSLDAARRPF